MRLQPPGLVLILVASTGACAGLGSGHSPTTSPTRADSFVTGLEIQEAGGSTVLDGVRLLVRPPSMTGLTPRTFRNPRGDAPVVYLDGVRVGDIRLLGQIHWTELESMRFMTPADATTRYGTGHFGGALIVETRGGG